MDEIDLREDPTPLRTRWPQLCVVVGGEQTGGRFALVEIVEQQGSELPRHLHHWEDEMLYVLEGSLAVWVAEGWTEVPVGEAVFLARGVEHAIAVSSTPRARVLVFLTPAGFEGFYREIGAAGCGVELLVATAARYGCEITGPVPERSDGRRSSPGKEAHGIDSQGKDRGGAS